MTLSEIITNAIRSAGGDGLVNEDLGCGCDLDELAPCGGPDFDECRIAKSRVLGPDEGIETPADFLGPGDMLYEPIETESLR